MKKSLVFVICSLMAHSGVAHAIGFGGAIGARTDTMEVAQAVMVTVELDFGTRIPTVAEALKQIERRSTPDDGRGRTFAILDAYGEPTADKKLHISMHVSSEKPGVGELIFRRTGELLWRSRINQGGKLAPSEKNLGIYLDDGKGGTYLLNGSGKPQSILDAQVDGIGRPVRDLWPSNTERELTFLYSACGCPVKVKAKRVGERTRRTQTLPVMFPDDPAALSVINRLMKW